jgi:hypothetical protein
VRYEARGDAPDTLRRGKQDPSLGFSTSENG